MIKSKKEKTAKKSGLKIQLRTDMENTIQMV